MRELMSYLPEWYRDSPETVAVQKAIQPEIDMIWSARNDLLLQLNPNTATWGLAYWEKAFGLPVDETRPLAQRRSRVVARIRGLGTTTVERLRTVVEAFCPGHQVTIVELYNEYVVEIYLKVTDAVPSDLAGLQTELDLIMPAHLGWRLVFALESTGTVHSGACSEMSSRLDLWPMLANELESTGTVHYGACSEISGRLDLWPMLVNELESAGGAVMAGPLEFHARVEIYPYEQEDENV